MITTDRQPVYQPLHARKACVADEAEFNEIVRDHSSRLIRIVLCLTKNQYIAEDIVQETFLKLWEKRATLTPENVGGWLYRVAWNLSLGHIRKEAGRTKLHAFWTDQQYHSAGAEERLVQKENTKVFKKIYDRLPEKQQATPHRSTSSCQKPETALASGDEAISYGDTRSGRVKPRGRPAANLFILPFCRFAFFRLDCP